MEGERVDMPKRMEAIFQDASHNLRFFKQQQWTVTNYALVAYHGGGKYYGKRKYHGNYQGYGHSRGYRYGNRYWGHRYSYRPSGWQTLGCVAVGPVWYCP